MPRTQGRWSYKTTPKPRIAIRKSVEDEPRPVPVITSATSNVQTSFPTESLPANSLTNLSEEQSPSFNPKKGQHEPGFEDELDESESEDVNVNVNLREEVQPSEQILPAETLNIEISTPADFNDIYYEIATIKSPYTFQVTNYLYYLSFEKFSRIYSF